MICDKCGYDICSRNFKRHNVKCDGKIPRTKKPKLPDKIKCNECGYDIYKGQINNHKKKCNGLGPKIARKSNKGRGWTKGKKLNEIHGEEKANLIRKVISSKLTGKPGRPSSGKSKDPLKEQERKNKISEKMKGNNNWKNSIHVSGRGKKGKYQGFFFASSWELAFIIYCIEHDIHFVRNWKKFEYINDAGCKKNYVPDFIVNDVYIEIKGYITKNVLLKKEQFPYDLQIYDLTKMKEILNYVIQKYGKNFVDVLKD